jgi:hypothetical protein
LRMPWMCSETSFIVGILTRVLKSFSTNFKFH